MGGAALHGLRHESHLGTLLQNHVRPHRPAAHLRSLRVEADGGGRVLLYSFEGFLEVLKRCM